MIHFSLMLGMPHFWVVLNTGKFIIKYPNVCYNDSPIKLLISAKQLLSRGYLDETAEQVMNGIGDKLVLESFSSLLSESV